MEGRRHKRAQIKIGCWIVGQDGESCCCSTYDISDNGISITTTTPLPVGQTACLQFYTPQSASALSISAEVIWSDTGQNPAMGLRFLDITEEELRILREMASQMRQREVHAAQRHGRY
ncbi:pilZ domain protein [Geobacter sp. OR-1]|uniref:PilZ domain-containing protein n=1 Tax=Geobacter sp. OR-1 TaxID=1266765 RepID=UPI000541EBB7|nr:PilZ domain-containing protein [Geobacter sp. OR-1]GAM09179.1 pilZ domain protein [Geobacter sp. OR-1]